MVLSPWVVPTGAKRFDELKVGDKVSITYNNTVSARLKAPGEPSVNTVTGTTTAGHYLLLENGDLLGVTDRWQAITKQRCFYNHKISPHLAVSTAMFLAKYFSCVSRSSSVSCGSRP
jgi:hypothetical protein